eukprot:1617256-Amphidinium_carterae.1
MAGVASVQETTPQITTKLQPHMATALKNNSEQKVSLGQPCSPHRNYPSICQRVLQPERPCQGVPLVVPTRRTRFCAKVCLGLHWGFR